MSDLPARTHAAEDAWVADLEGAAPDVLLARAHAALGAGRPTLAARVVGLLPPDVAAAEPGLDRARAAARLLLLAPPDRRGPVLAELEEAVQACRTAHVARARARHRKNARDLLDPTKPRRRPRGTRGR
jgi:hypothetical protein